MPVYELVLDVAKLNAGAKDAITILKKVSTQAEETDKALGKFSIMTIDIR